MKLLLLVFLCLLPLVWSKGYLITTEDTTKTPTIDNIVDEDGSDYTVDEDGSEYINDNNDIEEIKSMKTTCQQFSKSLTKICKKIEDGTTKKSGKDYIGGMEASWRRDILQMEKTIAWQKIYEPEDYRLVSARADKSSMISEYTKICIFCDITKSPNSIVEEAGTNYSDDEDEDNKPGQEKTACEQFPKILPRVCKKIEDGTIKKSGKDYIGGLEAPWRRDIVDMKEITKFLKFWEQLQQQEDDRLVSARVDKGSSISEMTKICIFCGKMPSANPANVPR